MMEMKERQEAILAGLNESQREAVIYSDGPVLVIAGAGSGKTRVLTCRVAYILAQGVDPSKVLALTFTKKAAEEMKERIVHLVGRRVARGVVMGTFHSVFIRFLREFSVEAKIDGNFTIYDRSDSESAIKACLKDLGISDDKNYKPRAILEKISRLKNGFISPDDYYNNEEWKREDVKASRARFHEVYRRYQEMLHQNKVMDFDDILFYTYQLIDSHEDVLKILRERFLHILVDEYQDTNEVQYKILSLISGHNTKLCVVGDDSQSIYGFRGAQIKNILNFKNDFNSKVIKLEQNYRSTQNIVDAANSLIAHNKNRIPKTCFSTADVGEKIRVFKSYTEVEEAVQIVGDIQKRLMDEKAEYQDFAILYRTNSQSRALEEALRRRNIPYIIYSGHAFYDRVEIKDMMAYFKLCVNPYDNEAFKRIINKPARGIGDTSIAGLISSAKANNCSLFEAISLDDYENYGLRSAAVKKLRDFKDNVNKVLPLVATGDCFDIAQKIYDSSGLLAAYKLDTSIEGQARVSNLEELLSSVQTFKEEKDDEFYADYDGDEEPIIPVFTLADYLETVSLLTNADTSEAEDRRNRVALMTVHAAKGLEFPYVYISGMEENLFPSGNHFTGVDDLEEERRLFYVALTRAKKVAAVSFSTTRLRNGQHDSNPPSRFLKEIDPKFLSKPIDEVEYRSLDSVFGRGGFGGYSTRRTGYSHTSSSSGPSKYSAFSNYGRSGSVRFEPRRPAGPSEKPAPAMTTRVVQPTVKPDVIDPNFVPVPMTELFVGERVEHNRFGPGIIKEITGEVPELKAVIEFDNYGSKVLLLKYAKLRPLK